MFMIFKTKYLFAFFKPRKQCIEPIIYNFFF